MSEQGAPLGRAWSTLLTRRVHGARTRVRTWLERCWIGLRAQERRAWRLQRLEARRCEGARLRGVRCTWQWQVRYDSDTRFAGNRRLSARTVSACFSVFAVAATLHGETPWCAVAGRRARCRSPTPGGCSLLCRRLSMRTAGGRYGYVRDACGLKTSVGLDCGSLCAIHNGRSSSRWEREKAGGYRAVGKSVRTDPMQGTLYVDSELWPGA